jgi:hypothetical protein
MELPLVSWSVCAGGHVIFGASGVTTGGVTGVGALLLEQPAMTNALATTPITRPETPEFTTRRTYELRGGKG